jgi:lipid-A-disaccharide synthase
VEIALFAGEASGDLHGALLAEEIAARRPGARIWGVGGEKMRGAGVEILHGIDELAVLGFAEVFVRLPFFLRLFGELRAAIESRRPDAVVLIDYPGLNLRLAKAAKSSGIPVAYYISPQVWAWGERRVSVIRRYVDRMIVVLPFEKPYYAERGVSASFVGHPLVSVARARRSRKETRRALGVPEGKPLVGLLPGSRAQEVRSHVPLFVEALAVGERAGVVANAALARAPTVPESLVEHFLARSPDRIAVTTDTYDLMDAADLLLVASGTATLEAAIFGTPMIVVYRTSPVSYAIGRALVRVPHIALANLVAGERIVPELVQDAATPARLGAEMASLLADDALRRSMRSKLAAVRARLGEAGAAGRAAEIVLDLARAGRRA